MDELIQLLEQIQELAGFGIEALQGAAAEAGGAPPAGGPEGAPPEGGPEGAPPEEFPPGA